MLLVKTNILFDRSDNNILKYNIIIYLLPIIATSTTSTSISLIGCELGSSIFYTIFYTSKKLNLFNCYCCF